MEYTITVGKTWIDKHREKIHDIVGCVNSKSFLGYPSGALFLHSVSVKPCVVFQELIILEFEFESLMLRSGEIIVFFDDFSFILNNQTA